MAKTVTNIGILEYQDFSKNNYVAKKTNNNQTLLKAKTFDIKTLRLNPKPDNLQRRFTQFSPFKHNF